MGRLIPIHRPGLAQGLGRGDPVLCLQRRDLEDYLHYKCRRIAEPGAAENAENYGLVPNLGGSNEADLPGHPQL